VMCINYLFIYFLVVQFNLLLTVSGTVFGTCATKTCGILSLPLMNLKSRERSKVQWEERGGGVSQNLIEQRPFKDASSLFGLQYG
jgi:hypothetical protein